MNDYDKMHLYVDSMKTDGPDSSFFRAILALHDNMFARSKRYIESTRSMLDTELTALVGESYTRAYYVVVRIQMLAELEEIIQFKQMSETQERRRIYLSSWNSRLDGCEQNVEVWSRVLKIRALAIPPKEDKDVWITFANLCRKSFKMGLAQRTLYNLLDHEAEFSDPEILRNDPQVVFACLKHLWASGNQKEAYEQMKHFTKILSDSLGIANIEDTARLNEIPNSANGLVSLLARCHLKMGDWQISRQQNRWTEAAIPDILGSYLAAKSCDPSLYKAHHAWASANFEVLNFYEQNSDNFDHNVVLKHTIDSLQGECSNSDF